MILSDVAMRFLRGALKSPILTTPADKLTIEQTTAAWIVLDYLNGAIRRRREDLRDRLMRKAENFGRRTDKGGQLLNIEGAKVTRERRISPAPDAKMLKMVLDAAEIGRNEVFTRKEEHVLDPSKVKHLVALGRLDPDEVDRCKKVTWALKVKTPQHVFRVLDNEFGKPEDLEIRPPTRKRSQAAGQRKE